MEVRDPIHRFCPVCGQEWCTCGGPYAGTSSASLGGNVVGENIATEKVWSEPDENGVRTLLAALGDPIPEGAPTPAQRQSEEDGGQQGRRAGSG